MSSATSKHDAYDVVIVGGAATGVRTAWLLASNSVFNGKLPVVESGPTFPKAKTRVSNNFLRQQFVD